MIMKTYKVVAIERNEVLYQVVANSEEEAIEKVENEGEGVTKIESGLLSYERINATLKE